MIKSLPKFDLFLFDMDGTLVDSHLDFDQLRKILGFPKGAAILEYLDTVKSSEEKRELEKKVREFELEGAKVATLIEGVDQVLRNLKEKEIPCGLITRNCKEVTEFTLNKMGLNFELVITRDDKFLAKPSGESILYAANFFEVDKSRTVYIGDYLFDIQAAKGAGVHSILYAPKKKSFELQANFVIRSFTELSQFY